MKKKKEKKKFFEESRSRFCFRKEDVSSCCGMLAVQREKEFGKSKIEAVKRFRCAEIVHSERNTCLD